MPRTLGDVPTGGSDFPLAGKHACRCVKAVAWKSPKKGTAAAKLTFVTRDGEHSFDDAVFVSPKGLWRLALVAQRLCDMPKDTPLPDDNEEACKILARYIVDHATGKDATITIDERQESYMVTEGPEQGQKKEVMRRRVAGGGYERIEGAAPIAPLGPSGDPDNDLPF